ncbi:Bug family tripartite tricarboxylate transporter substrate binding protein [Rhodoplanes sp. Z2-YC6860]|uniref:Bug family tripartite tricarboxylate transporter substrate binding protein n=1 Tax=Rhodoplanes sp. Z2-YC6860 TaxID=674703 RepID=UPI00078BA9D9|nr:tripartite tricarboxylate transporter substrate-binding protein [Rhodoplanes sp. Z2-YC6860]AMN38788.1 extra-cytoplasmic solute receptor protein [Rhodoplanes sp. Z2-YC6860]
MTAITRRSVVAGLAATAALLPDRALAAWPERNISMLHGLTAGGGVDVSARLIAEGLSRRLGQQVVVEPKPGAAGTLAAAQVARSPADGYTLGFIPSGHAVTAATYKSLPYRSIEDFTIIGQVIEFPFVIVTYPDHTIRNVSDLIQAAKTRHEPVLGGVPGAGTPQHLLIEYFSRLAGIKIQVVPYRGGNQSLTELLGKRIDFLIDPPVALIGQIKSGALHAIGVSGETRYAPLPETGTIAEAGFPGFSITSWMGVVGPAKMPKEIAERLNKELNELVAEPTTIERIHALGSEPKAGTPADFTKRIATDIERWNKVIDEAKIERI